VKLSANQFEINQVTETETKRNVGKISAKRLRKNQMTYFSCMRNRISGSGVPLSQRKIAAASARAGTAN